MDHNEQLPVGVSRSAVESRKKGVKAYSENPFLAEQTVISTRKKRVKVQGGKAILDLQSGEVEGIAEIVSVREVDDEQFVKLFTQNLRLFFDLTSNTMKLLQVILYQVQKVPNGDTIMLNLSIVEHYFETTRQEPIAKATFHRAIKELIDKKFIAESTMRGIYYINPHLFFNGDRVRFIQEFKRRRADAAHSRTVGAMQTGTLPPGPDPLATSSSEE